MVYILSERATNAIKWKEEIETSTMVYSLRIALLPDTEANLKPLSHVGT